MSLKGHRSTPISTRTRTVRTGRSQARFTQRDAACFRGAADLFAIQCAIAGRRTGKPQLGKPYGVNWFLTWSN